jgi:CHAT domain-containing protein
MGFSAILLGAGTRSLVASVLPVPADRTAELMLDVHRQLSAGRGPADALAAAQQSFAAGGDSASRATAAAFVCFGAG